MLGRQDSLARTPKTIHSGTQQRSSIKEPSLSLTPDPRPDLQHERSLAARMGTADTKIHQAKKPAVLQNHPAMQPRDQHRALIGRNTRHFWRHENKTMDLLIKCRSALSRGSTREVSTLSTWPQQQGVLRVTSHTARGGTYRKICLHGQ